MVFAGNAFQQIVGITVDTNGAVVLADIFLILSYTKRNL